MRIGNEVSWYVVKWGFAVLVYQVHIRGSAVLSQDGTSNGCVKRHELSHDECVFTFLPSHRPGSQSRPGSRGTWTFAVHSRPLWAWDAEPVQKSRR